MRSVDDEEWKKLCDGPNGEVWVLKKCEKELSRLKQPRMLAKALAILSRKFCKFEDLEDVSSNQFKIYPGVQKSGGIKAKLAHVRGGDVRIYGALGSIDGNRAFFATHAVMKKANKMDPGDAKTAIARLENISELIDGAQL